MNNQKENHYNLFRYRPCRSELIVFSFQLLGYVVWKSVNLPIDQLYNNSMM